MSLQFDRASFDFVQDEGRRIGDRVAEDAPHTILLTLSEVEGRWMRLQQ